MRLDLDLLRRQLPNNSIVYFDTTESTMGDAAGLVRAGCGHGTLAVAEEQTAGHGRYARKWHSERETGVYVSMVLRLSLPPEDMPTLTLALGLGAAEAIATEAGAACDLRWPNDVLIGGRKCAGILAQHDSGACIAGIGINVNQAEFPADVAEIATSLRIATGREQSRERVLIALVGSIERYSRMLVEQGRSAIREHFCTASSYALGKHVVVERLEGDLEGITDGLDEHGFLYVRTNDGRRELILAGGVRPA